MTDPLDSVLLEAYELIEANRIDEARALLTPLLDEYPNDADLWWVYSHAVEDRQEAKKALERVLDLDPNFTDASKLISQIENESTQPSGPVAGTGITPIRSLETTPSSETEGEFEQEVDFGDSDYLEDFGDSPSDFDNFDDDEFDDEYITETEDSSPNWGVLATIAVVLAIVSAIVLWLAVSDEQPPTPTAIAGNATSTAMMAEANNADASDTLVATITPDPTPTSTATSTSSPTPTETEQPTNTHTPTSEPTETPTLTVTPSPEPTENPIDSIAMVLQEEGFDISTAGPSVAETSLGETLVIEFCLASDERSSLLSNAFLSLAEVRTISNLAVDAVAVSLYDCERDDTLRIIGVAVEDIEAFQTGEIDESTFQRRWTVIG